MSASRVIELPHNFVIKHPLRGLVVLGCVHIEEKFARAFQMGKIAKWDVSRANSLEQCAGRVLMRTDRCFRRTQTRRDAVDSAQRLWAIVVLQRNDRV